MEISIASVFPGRHSDIFVQEPLAELDVIPKDFGTHPAHYASYTVLPWASRWGSLTSFGIAIPYGADLRLPATLLSRSAGLMVPRSPAGPIRYFSHRDHYVAPSRFMAYIPVSQGTHAGHTQAVRAIGEQLVGRWFISSPAAQMPNR